MDTPPQAPSPQPIEDVFEDESIMERILGLNEMFPEPLRRVLGETISKSTSALKWAFWASRSVTWLVCSTAVILVVPISLETERLDYEQQMKRRERNILMGPETGSNI